jgi:type I restriction-modification system DNA methylase subunit
MKNYPIQSGKETWKQLEEVSRFGYSYSTIFEDFVEMCLLSQLSLTDNLKHLDILERVKQNKLTGAYEDQYMQLVGRYKENKTHPKGKRPIDYMANAFSCLIRETKELGQDILGEIYMAYIGSGQNGQFFTPFSIIEVTTQIVGSPTSGQSVLDPACGSGRFFISMGKLNKDSLFIGVDIAPICVQMSALNMWLFDLNANIYCGNSITMKMSRLWRVRKGGFIYESKVESMPEPMRTQIQTQAQQTLFDFNEIKKKAA